MSTFKNEFKHDFIAKLRQPSLFPFVKNYVAWRRIALKEITEAPYLMPLSINLDLTTACNFRCGHCVDSDILNSKTNYVHKQLIFSLGNMIKRGLRSVILIGGGEPTLYPKFGEVVRFLKMHGIQVAIASNGSRNRIIYDIADCLSENDWVRFSLDAGQNDTFQRIHKPKRSISLDEICSHAPLIKTRNPDISIGFSFVIVWSGNKSAENAGIIPNIDEIVMATELARANHFDYISFKPFLTCYPDGAEVIDVSGIENFNQTIIEHIRELIDEARKYETGDFKVIESLNLNAFLENRWRDLTRQPQMCHMQAFRQVLSPLGLFNCPAYRGAEKARVADKNSYCGVGKTRATQKSVAAFLENFDASRECANITCLYNSVNWWLEKAVRGEFNIEPVDEFYDYFL